MAERLPPPDITRIASTPPAILALPAGTVLWRILDTAGRYPSAWNEFRFAGPTSHRFDHHTRLSGPNRWKIQKYGIVYASLDPITCFAEVFQQGRVIERSSPRKRRLIAFRLAKAIKVLDLTGGWPVQAEGNMAINTGSHAQARAWSRAIYQAHPTLVGLRYFSSLNSKRYNVALYERAAAVLPAAATFNRALDDLALLPHLLKAANELDYDIGM